MGFTVEQDCPQCGAPIELDETDHLVSCPYCNIKNFLFAPNYPRFVLPHKAKNKEILYAPYLRFKGNVYYCMGTTIGHRIVDITHVGLSFDGIPVSLGVRPQAMKMRFVTPDTQGSFLRFSLRASDVLTRAAQLATPASSRRLFHRTFIGETLSLIYLPLYEEGDRIFDAVLNRPITKVSQEEDVVGKSIHRSPRWKVTFLPTLCPRCGWNLDGERDSVVLICRNCETVWEVVEGRFTQVRFYMVPGEDGDRFYLPFWRISAADQESNLNSFADFIRLTDQPRVVQANMEKQEIRFWTPAFKIRPQVFLNLCKRLTLSQCDFETREAIPRRGDHPVTLPQSEAAQTMKITLASLVLNKKEVLPCLPRLRFKIKGSSLVYLPFARKGHDLIQDQLGICINRNTLEFGRRL
jgi:hypothetical protein